jgi:hypothetical protein
MLPHSISTEPKCSSGRCLSLRASGQSIASAVETQEIPPRLGKGVAAKRKSPTCTISSGTSERVAYCWFG